MATAEVQRVITIAVDDNCPKEEESPKAHDMPNTEVAEAPRTKVEDNQEVIAINTDEAIALEVGAKLDVKDLQAPAELAMELKEAENHRETKKAEKAPAKAAVVPVDDEPNEEKIAEPAEEAPDSDDDEVKGEVKEEKKEDECEKKAHEE